MKVGILTFCNTTSYGAALQMYALYRSVEKFGHDAELLHYQNRWMKEERHTVAMQNKPYAVMRLKKTVSAFRHRHLWRAFRGFEASMVCMPERVTSDKNALRALSDRYDAVICGSDQVWNPDITGADLSYFLNFCGARTKRISYAPSFGVEALPKDFAEAAAKELARFSSLSVREEAGQALIRDMIGKDAELVLDPTLLLTAEEWEALETAHPMAQGEYILYYPVRSAGCLWSYCEAFAERKGLKILRIGRSVKSKDTDRVKYLFDVSPQELLFLLHHAKYVVTNSFHGTAFAINYRKNFFVELSSATNSRLSQIVRTFGLEEQVVREAGAVLRDTTDYKKTEELLPALRDHSLRFLREALTESSEL